MLIEKLFDGCDRIKGGVTVLEIMNNNADVAAKRKTGGLLYESLRF